MIERYHSFPKVTLMLANPAPKIRRLKGYKGLRILGKQEQPSAFRKSWQSGAPSAARTGGDGSPGVTEFSPDAPDSPGLAPLPHLGEGSGRAPSTSA